MGRLTRREALTVAGVLGVGLAAGCAASTTRAGGPAHRQVTAPPSPSPSAPASAAPARTVEIDHGPRTVPAVALTFHGQGDPALATALLAELEHGGARATVFAVGTWLIAQPQMAHRVAQGGHELANHTLHHRPMATMAEGEAYAEVAGCAAELRRLTGSIGRYVRPSGTAHANPAVLAAAHRAGYGTVVGYDVDSLDYTDPGAQAVQRTVAAQVRPGSIVSLHLGHPGTVTAMPAVLAGLRSRGLRPVTVAELIGPR